MNYFSYLLVTYFAGYAFIPTLFIFNMMILMIPRVATIIKVNNVKYKNKVNTHKYVTIPTLK